MFGDCIGSKPYLLAVIDFNLDLAISKVRQQQSFFDYKRRGRFRLRYGHVAYRLPGQARQTRQEIAKRRQNTVFANTSRP